MAVSGTERGRQLARNLVELLGPYEEELMALEAQSPLVGPLRRAVGIAIAEAISLINDDSSETASWPPPDESGRGRS